MRAKGVGSVSITTKSGETAVLANDSKGTNLLHHLPSVNLTLQPL
jgi:hypothetical protein